MPHSFGWHPSRPDQRDYLYTVSPQRVTTLPPSVDLRPKCPAIVDQGPLGSCTENAGAALIQYDEMQKNEAAPLMPSRLFMYYNARALEGTIASDAGSSVRDFFRAVATWGYPAEACWPYVITQFAVQPPQACYQQAITNRKILYQRVPQVLQQLQGVLAMGLPYTLGFTVYESFESAQVAQTGIVPMPDPNEQTLGGHCVDVVGYDTSKSWWITRNSWGTAWGDQGYFYMPYQYFLDPNLSGDIWIMQSVQS